MLVKFSLQNKFPFFIYIYFVICKCFPFEPVYNVLVYLIKMDRIMLRKKPTTYHYAIPEAPKPLRHTNYAIQDTP